MLATIPLIEPSSLSNLSFSFSSLIEFVKMSIFPLRLSIESLCLPTIVLSFSVFVIRPSTFGFSWSLSTLLLNHHNYLLFLINKFLSQKIDFVLKDF